MYLFEISKLNKSLIGKYHCYLKINYLRKIIIFKIVRTGSKQFIVSVLIRTQNHSGTLIS